MSDDTDIPTVRSFATSHLIPCRTLNPRALVMTANELMAYPPARTYQFICALQDYDQTPNLAPGQRLSHRVTVMEHGRHSSSRQIARANREASENVHRFCP